MKLTYKGKEELQGGVTKFAFDVPDGVIWRPGQFIHYTLPHDNADERGDERWFTISSAPHEGEITITTRISDEGGSSFKKKLSSLEAGDTVEADAPEGEFTIDDYDAEYVFVVGGIGVTPVRSMISQMNHEGKSVRMELLYANRDESTEAYKDELEAFAADHDDVVITDFYGDHFIDEAALKTAGEKLDNPIYYITGPEPMVEAFEKTLKDMGVDDNHARFDYFPGYTAETQ